MRAITGVSPDCPKCKGTGKLPLGIVAGVATCDVCEGAGKVTLERFGELEGLKINLQDSEPPDTEPDPKVPA
jgi:DnaJ-class molecular chaperone